MDKTFPVFVSVSKAEKSIQESVVVSPVSSVPLSSCLGRTLGQDIEASEHIPPFDNSAMDGYALTANDAASGGTRLTLVDDIRAGMWPETPVKTGECIRIMTGAPMPEGADTVVPVEDTELLDEHTIVIQEAPVKGQHVRYRGEDIRPGQCVLQKGAHITPSVIGLLASLGVTDVLAHEIPNVAVVATGDELVEISETPQFGKIRNSNGPALSAQAAAVGCRIVSSSVARDNRKDAEATLARALAADVIIVSGGVSVGEHDHVKEALETIGVEIFFWKVKQKPGKPLVFGKIGERLVFGLPGNPVSSAVCFERYVRPALLKMMGRAKTYRNLEPAKLTESIAKKRGLYHFVRGILDEDDNGERTVRPTGPQGSNLYSSVVAANCLIHLSEEMENPTAGTLVRIERLIW